MAVQSLTLSVISTSNITFTLAARTEVDNLVANDIKIFLSANGTGAFTAFTDFTITGATATVATIVPNTAFAEADVIRVALDDGTDTSNRVFADFSSAFTSGAGTVIYQVPSVTGNYVINNTTVNDEAVAFNSDVYIASNQPLAANCSMALAKEYLVKFVNTKYNLNVILKDASNANVSDGNYELLYTETIQ